MRNNPVRFIDPDGKDGWDFLLGIVHAIGSNLTMSTLPADTRPVKNDSHYSSGKSVGDMLSIAMGGAEMFLGRNMIGTGSGAFALTGGSSGPASAAAIATGIGVASHGFGVVSKAVSNLSKEEGRFQKASGNNSLTNSKSYSEKTYKQFENQLKKDGEKSLLKSKKKLEKNIVEHQEKMERYKEEGGHVSSVEREISTFKKQVKAIDDVLKNSK